MTLRRGHRGWLRLPDYDPADVTIKPLPYLPVYEQLFAPMRKKAFAMLELGVWRGHSLAMWRDAFGKATIVGVDLAPPAVDLGTRVHIISGDQADAALMQRIRDEYAPGGFDVIIDDASHLGVTTARSLQALYRDHLRPGGLYCIEDWGTGYMPSWSDGGRIARPLDVRHLDRTDTQTEGEDEPVPMPSHDIGAVGLIKRLIDHTASGTVRSAQPEAVVDALAIDSMTIREGLAVLRKPIE